MPSSPARPQEHNSPADGQPIRFDRYQVDIHSGELRKEGRKVRLQAQPFQLLVFLLRNAGRVVTREEVKRELWPADTFVDFDHGLAAAVNKIREALCDSADKPKFIETLPRRGYRFIGKLELNPPIEIRPKLEEVPPHATALDFDASDRTESKPQSRTQMWGIGAALLVLVAGIAGAIALMLVQRQQKPSPTAQEWDVTQFTSYPGEASAPSFSPDGSRIAFGWGPKGQERNDLYVKVRGAEARLQLTHHPSMWVSSAWSPDGTQIAFMRLAGTDTGLYLVPALGGPEQKLLATTTPYSLAAPISWSPDGKWIAYDDLVDEQVGDRMFLFSVDTRQSHLFFHDPACTHEAQLTFSNSGNQVAWVCVRKLDQLDLMVGDPQGKSRRLLRTVNLIISGIDWMPDDSKLVIAQQNGVRGELYEVNLSDGSMKPLNASLGQAAAYWPAVSAKTGAVAWDSWRFKIDLVRVNLQNPAAPAEPVFESSRNENQATISPDGKYVAFDSDRSGLWHVWIGDADGSNLTQVTRGGEAGFPRWSPDSRRLVYAQTDGDSQSIFVFDVNERVPRKLLTATRDADAPFWSPDGKWIYFRDHGFFLRRYWRCSLDCNRNETLMREGPKAYSMQTTQDGKFWYYVIDDGSAKVFREKLVGDHVEGREEVEGLPVLMDDFAMFVARKGIYFVAAAKPKTLEYFDFATQKTKEVLKTESNISSGIWVSSDERYALLPQWSDYHHDIMLAEPKK